MGSKFGFSFSWKRALGFSATKGKLSRAIGIPLTQNGRRQKLAKSLGCLLIPLIILVGCLISVM